MHYKLFVVTSRSCAHCDDFKENISKYEEIWSRYPQIQIVKLDSDAGFDPGRESGNLRSMVGWFPTMILIESDEYERSRGVPGYEYSNAAIYGTTYRKGQALGKPSIPISIKGVEEFLRSNVV